MAANRIGPPPVVLRVVVTPNNAELAGGVPMSPTRGETYVLMSALPEELRRRVELAVQARIAGM
jgi:hypothetical protein